MFLLHIKVRQGRLFFIRGDVRERDSCVRARELQMLLLSHSCHKRPVPLKATGVWFTLHCCVSERGVLNEPDTRGLCLKAAQ